MCDSHKAFRRKAAGVTGYRSQLAAQTSTEFPPHSSNLVLTVPKGLTPQGCCAEAAQTPKRRRAIRACCKISCARPPASCTLPTRNVLSGMPSTWSHLPHYGGPSSWPAGILVICCKSSSQIPRRFAVTGPHPCRRFNLQSRVTTSTRESHSHLGAGRVDTNITRTGFPKRRSQDPRYWPSNTARTP